MQSIDCIRFGAVWRSVVAETGYPPSKLPWLMLPMTNADAESDTCRFYSLSNKKEYKIHIPWSRYSTCIGASDGWLVIHLTKVQLMLFNPLTGSQIRLPSTLPTFMKKRNYNDKSVSAVVSWSSTSSFTVLVYIYAFLDLAFVRTGDKAWTRLRIPPLRADKLLDHKGLFYTHYRGTNVQVLDITGPNPSYTEVAEDRRDPHVREIYPSYYLVESSGDLFQLMRKFTFRDSQPRKTIGFEVLKLDPSGPKWTQAHTLGDHAFFLGRSCSMSMSIPTHDLPGLKGSCMYFSECEWYGMPSLRVFDLEDGSIKTYHPHDSYLTCPASIWFMPNLL